MKTWTNYSANLGAATTTWNYDQYRGWLNSKYYADQTTGVAGTTGTDCTYTPGGRLKTHTWARVGTGSQRITTTCAYGFDDGVSGNEHGDLTGVTYTNDPQSTPTVQYAYDRRGRQSQIKVGGTVAENLTYNDANELLTEAHVAGPLNGLTVTSRYDQFLRRTNLTLNAQPSSLSYAHGYDTANRLQSVTSGAYNATYGYLTNSPLVGTVTFKQNTTTRMTTTKTWDVLNRLQKTEHWTTEN